MFYKYNMKTQITVRDVDAGAYKEFKADAIRNGLTLGGALTLAMEKFRSELTKKRSKLSDFKPVDWGKGTERVSEEVDAILYGE